MVLDASVTLEWFLTEPGSSAAWSKVELLDSYVPVVPAIWELEVTNVLSMQVRRRGMPVAAARAALAEMTGLVVAVVDGSGSATLMQLSMDHDITTYDAAYLDVAMRGGWPLATFDRDLIRAAEKVGIELA